MSTRYDELKNILGTGSVGTPSSTPAADDQKQTSRRDELYSLLGESTAPATDTAASGASTTQRDAVLETRTQGVSAAGSQSAAPTAPLTQGSLAGEGRSAAGGGGGRVGRADTRADLQRQLNALDEAAAYVTTTEQSDAIEQQRRPIIEQLRQMDEEEGRTGVYTGGDRLKNLFSNARLATQQGLTKADHRIAQTADWLFGGIAKEGRALLNTTLQSINPNWGFENEDPLITQYNKRGEDVIAHNEAVAQKRIEEGKLSPTAWKYAPEVVAAIPDVVLAHLTAGASSGAQATSAGLEAASAAAQAGKAAQTIVPIANATKNMIKNPAWESAFAQTAGSSYEQALAEGATEEEANLYALLNGFANATIEVGGSDEALGGIQKLPQQLRDALEKGNNTAVMRWIKSTLNEAVEEVAQGSAEKALRGIYTNDVPLYSATDENAVINPTRAKEEALGGLVVGGLLGGGQSLLQAAINENRQSARSAQTAGQEQTGAEAQAAGVAAAGATPQSPAATAPIAEGSSSQGVAAVEDILKSGRVSNTTANDILNNASLSAQFEDITGIILDGTREENRRAIQRAAREYAYNAQNSESAAETAAVEAETEETIRTSGYGAYIRGVLKDGATVSDARDIIRNPEMRATWEQMTGKTLPENQKSAIKMIMQTRRANPVIPEQQTQQRTYPTVEEIIRPITPANDISAEGAPQSALQTAPLQGEPLSTQQEAQTQATEAAQDAQRAAPQAETPPTTQNAAQAAPDALNRQVETNAQEQETTATQNAAPAAYNRTTGQRERTDGANAVRGFSENVATDSAMEAALRREFEQNPEMYTRLANKDTLKKAQDIFVMGLDTARTELERAIGAAQSGQKLSPEMVPLSRMVANELTRRGDLEAARKIISDVAAELTSAGQLGQAGAILRNADPMTVLNTLQKAIDQINAEVGKKFGKRNAWKAELTAEEIKQISETDFSQDGAFEAIQQQIAERLGREMPATVAEKLRELRKVGMLANPKTQLKNLLGNAPLAVERKVSERLSGGIQELAVKAGIMSKEEQTRTLRVSQESKDLAKSVYKNNIDRITKKGNKGELRGILRNTRTYFNKGLLQKGIEKATGHQLNDAALDYVRRFTYDMLEKGDAPFVKSAFIDSLAQYCEAQGIKSEADVTETAFNYALDQAMAATFKDASALANLLNSIKDKAGIAGEALDVLFPFTTTPINIAKEFGKYSPLGYLQLLNAKGKSAAEVIDIVSRATTGSAVVAAGAILRSLGFITGAADDDKDKAAHDKAIGISPYSVLGKYSYEWAQPTGSALAMGASIYDAAKDGSSLIETLSNGIISAGDAYLEQSFYKDIIDLFQGYGSPTENVIRELLTGTASQFIPTIVGATARTIDPTVRTSYTGGNIIDDILAQAKVKTPGLSKSAPASVNVRGEETQRGNLGERIWDNFIAPWNTNRNGEEKNAVDKALDEVYEATGDKTIFRQVSPYKVDYGGESYQMTGEEREQFQKTQGQVHDDILQQIIDGTLWQKMDNDAKVKTMQFANEYALDAAKRELVESRGNDYSSDWDDEAELPDVGDYLAAKTTLKAAQDSKDYTLLDALVETVTEQKKDVQEKLNKDFSMLDELIYGKQRGVDAETIYTAKTEADANGNGKISQEELWYYLGLQKNMPEETKDVLWDILTTGKTGYSQYAEKQK